MKKLRPLQYRVSRPAQLYAVQIAERGHLLTDRLTVAVRVLHAAGWIALVRPEFLSEPRFVATKYAQTLFPKVMLAAGVFVGADEHWCMTEEMRAEALVFADAAMMGSWDEADSWHWLDVLRSSTFESGRRSKVCNVIWEERKVRARLERARKKAAERALRG